MNIINYNENEFKKNIIEIENLELKNSENEIVKFLLNFNDLIKQVNLNLDNKNDFEIIKIEFYKITFIIKDLMNEKNKNELIYNEELNKTKAYTDFLNSKITNSNNEFNHLLKNIDFIEKENDLNHSNLLKFKEINKELVFKSDIFNNNLDEYKIKNDKLKKINNKNKIIIKEKQNLINELNNKILEINIEFENIIEQNNILKEEKNNLNKEIKNLNQDNNLLTSHVNKNILELEEKENIISDLNMKMEFNDYLLNNNEEINTEQYSVYMNSMKTILLEENHNEQILLEKQINLGKELLEKERDNIKLIKLNKYYFNIIQEYENRILKLNK